MSLEKHRELRKPTSTPAEAKLPNGTSAVGSRVVRRILWGVVALVVLYTVLDGVAQVLPPHYSPISQAESDLAVGPYGYIMTINFVNRGVLSLLFILGFAGVLRLTGGKLERYRGGVVLLGVWGICAFLLVGFPTDAPSSPITWHGAIHTVVALVAFVAGALGTLWISLRIRSDQALRGARSFAVPISVIAVISLILLFGTLSAAIFGLVERVFIGSVLLWMLVMSIYLSGGASMSARHESRYRHNPQ